MAVSVNDGVNPVISAQEIVFPGAVIQNDNSGCSTIVYAGAVNTQTFTANGVFILPVGPNGRKPNEITVTIIGAGGGGGGGISAAASGTLAGGGGGGGGSLQSFVIPAALLSGTSVTVTIGTGGAGGASVTGGAGNNGTAGGQHVVRYIRYVLRWRRWWRGSRRGRHVDRGRGSGFLCSRRDCEHRCGSWRSRRFGRHRHERDDGIQWRGRGWRCGRHDG